MFLALAATVFILLVVLGTPIVFALVLSGTLGLVPKPYPHLPGNERM